jgi:hypothetical protein
VTSTATADGRIPSLAAGDQSGAMLQQLFKSMRFPHVSDAYLSTDPHLKGAAAQSARGFAKLRQRGKSAGK